MIKIFADTASIDDIKRMARNPLIKGFTTNPSLMKAAGVTNYEQACKEIIKYLENERPDTCVSIEVLSEEYNEIIRQAEKINSWSNKYPVYIKIPIISSNCNINTKAINILSFDGIKVNVTAVFLEGQIQQAYDALNRSVPSIISIFAGRIYDTGNNGVNICYDGKISVVNNSIVDNTEFLWASSRQVYDYVLAKSCSMDIITMTPALIDKLPLLGKGLYEYSVETSKMFYDDAIKAGFNL